MISNISSMYPTQTGGQDAFWLPGGGDISLQALPWYAAGELPNRPPDLCNQSQVADNSANQGSQDYRPDLLDNQEANQVYQQFIADQNLLDLRNRLDALQRLRHNQVPGLFPVPVRSCDPNLHVGSWFAFQNNPFCPPMLPGNWFAGHQTGTASPPTLGAYQLDGGFIGNKPVHFPVISARSPLNPNAPPFIPFVFPELSPSTLPLTGHGVQVPDPQNQALQEKVDQNLGQDVIVSESDNDRIEISHGHVHSNSEPGWSISHRHEHVATSSLVLQPADTSPDSSKLVLSVNTTPSSSQPVQNQPCPAQPAEQAASQLAHSPHSAHTSQSCSQSFAHPLQPAFPSTQPTFTLAVGCAETVLDEPTCHHDAEHVGPSIETPEPISPTILPSITSSDAAQEASNALSPLTPVPTDMMPSSPVTSQADSPWPTSPMAASSPPKTSNASSPSGHDDTDDESTDGYGLSHSPPSIVDEGLGIGDEGEDLHGVNVVMEDIVEDDEQDDIEECEDCDDEDDGDGDYEEDEQVSNDPYPSAMPRSREQISLHQQLINSGLWDVMRPGPQWSLLHSRIELMITLLAMESAASADDSLLDYADRCDASHSATGDYRIMNIVSKIRLTTKALSLANPQRSGASLVVKRHFANRQAKARSKLYHEGLKWLILLNAGTPYTVLLVILFDTVKAIEDASLTDVKELARSICTLRHETLREQFIPPILYLMHMYPLRLNNFFSDHFLDIPDAKCSDWGYIDAIMKRYSCKTKFRPATRSEGWSLQKFDSMTARLAAHKMPAYQKYLISQDSKRSSGITIVIATHYSPSNLNPPVPPSKKDTPKGNFGVLEKVRAKVLNSIDLPSGRDFLELLSKRRFAVRRSLGVRREKYAHFSTRSFFRQSLLLIDTNSQPLLGVLTDMPTSVRLMLLHNANLLAHERIVSTNTHQCAHQECFRYSDPLPSEPVITINWAQFLDTTDHSTTHFAPFKEFLNELRAWCTREAPGSNEAQFGTLEIYYNCAPAIKRGGAILAAADCPVSIIIPELSLSVGVENGDFVRFYGDHLTFFIQHYVGRAAFFVFK